VKALPILIGAFCLTLAACGGGGGGGGAGSSTPTPTTPLMTMGEMMKMEEEEEEEMVPHATVEALKTLLETQGQPSSSEDAKNALNEFIESERYSIATSLMATNQSTVPVVIARFNAKDDTDAEMAWAKGWTGKGVKVGVLDEFEPFQSRATHGEVKLLMVHQVAPEAMSMTRYIPLTSAARRALPSGTDIDEAQNTAIATGYQNFADNEYHIVNSSFSTSRWDRGASALIPLNEWQDLIDGQIEKDFFIKLSTSSEAEGYPDEMLFVFSAGNDGEGCTSGTISGGTISGCNLNAAAIHQLRANGNADAGDRLIFVGSVDENDLIATYSHRAGDMGSNFIVARDNVDFYQREVQGTSFSAPRVAGAAALVRQKFPSLNGPNLKQVLLRTADDLGDDGVDPIYGYGKLNVLSALSPVDRLEAQ